MEGNRNILKHEELRAKFNPEGSPLRKQQMLMLDILLEVDRICKKHNLKYWIASGTTLGAIRHKEFIPWDDDLDIEMLRPEYLKFLKIAKSEMNKRYILQSEEPNHLDFYMKVLDLKTKLYRGNNPTWEKLKYQCVYIDIFPIEKSSRLIAGISGKISKVLLRHWWSYRSKSVIAKKILDFNYFMVTKIIFPMLRLVNIFTPKDHYRNNLGVGALSPRRYSDIFPLKEIEFEGHKFPCPNNHHKYLERMYGDYTKLPDLDKLHIHSNGVEFLD